jgi:hypothetical protein
MCTGTGPFLSTFAQNLASCSVFIGQPPVDHEPGRFSVAGSIHSIMSSFVLEELHEALYRGGSDYVCNDASYRLFRIPIGLQQRIAYDFFGAHIHG